MTYRSHLVNFISTFVIRYIKRYKNNKMSELNNTLHENKKQIKKCV